MCIYIYIYIHIACKHTDYRYRHIFRGTTLRCPWLIASILIFQAPGNKQTYHQPQTLNQNLKAPEPLNRTKPRHLHHQGRLIEDMVGGRTPYLHG